MIIIGAKGFAKEVLEVLLQLGKTENIVFFDNISKDVGDLLFDQFPIIHSELEVKEHFRTIDTNYVLGIGNPQNRKKMATIFDQLGGKLTTIVSPYAKIGVYGTYIEMGCTIMTGTVVTSDVKIGKGSLLNLNCTIGHNTNIGEFVEICPNVSISGNVSIGDHCFIGTGAILLPGVKIGNDSIIAAGAVVTQTVPDNSMVAGIPAQIKKTLKNG